MRLIDIEAPYKIEIELDGGKCHATVTAPTVDAVPVVRCKDCRHRDPEDHKCECGEMERQGCPFPVDDDYFCKYGARREWGDDDE